MGQGGGGVSGLMPQPDAADAQFVPRRHDARWYPFRIARTALICKNLIIRDIAERIVERDVSDSLNFVPEQGIL